MQHISIDISVNRHGLPLQYLLAKQISILVLKVHFLKFSTPWSIKVDGAKVYNLGGKCTSRI